MSAEELVDILKRSRLSTTDREIAAQYLIWRMPMADIGAAVGYDRSTVGYRLRHVIAPEIEKLNGAEKKIEAGA